MQHYIKLKLSEKGSDLIYYTNNVCVGIKEVLKFPSINKDQNCIKRLNELKQELEQIPIPYDHNQIREDDIRETDRIRKQAYSLVAKYLD